MSDIRQRLSDFVRDNPDAVVVAFAVMFLVMLTLAVLNFLWARRDAVWRQQLTEARLAARGFVHPTATPITADPVDPALVERDGRTVYSVAGRQGESAAAAPPSRPAPAAPAHWQTQIAPRPATSAAWALREPEATEAPPAAGTPSQPPAPAGVAAPAYPLLAPPPVAAPPVASPAAESLAALTPEPPAAVVALEAAAPPPAISEPLAVEQYQVWQSVTTTEEDAPAATDGAAGGAAAASAYAAWDQVTTPALADAPATPAPVLEPAPALPPPPVTEAVPDGGDGPDILLVEDDQNVGKVYRLLMESKGFAVRHAVDGVAGLELARARRPDLILLDVMMPRMNGILFLQSLRAEQRLKDVPVVILSNFREPRLVERALALGAIEYIVKAQTRPDAMLAAIPRWLKGERALST